MANDFDEVRFPEDVSYGSTGGPAWSTDVVVRASGVEKRNQNWSLARYKFNARYGVKTFEQLSNVIEFFWARAGRARGFRYKDWSDYTSAADGYSPPTLLDQNIGTGNGVLLTFQTRKRYTSGAITRDREIYKIVAGTFLLAVNSVLQSSPGDYTVDINTGIVTFTSAPAGGAVITCGYEFDVPVRFDSDEFQVNIEFFRGGSLDIPMIEVRPC